MIRSILPFLLGTSLALPLVAQTMEVPQPASPTTEVAPAMTRDAGPDMADGPHGWLPEAITLPDDMEVVIDSEIGSSTRLLQFSTRSNAGDLVARWREQLDETGWQVNASPEMIEEQQILFSGPGISSAQIIIIPSQADGSDVIQIDASLTNE